MLFPLPGIKLLAPPQNFIKHNYFGWLAELMEYDVLTPKTEIWFLCKHLSFALLKLCLHVVYTVDYMKN